MTTSAPAPEAPQPDPEHQDRPLLALPDHAPALSAEPAEPASRGARIGKAKAVLLAPLAKVRHTPRWARFALPAALVVGLAAGFGIAVAVQPPVNTTKEYQALSDELNAKISSQDATIQDLQTAGSEKDTQIQTLQSAADDVAAREEAVAGKEADVAAREKKVTAAEKQVEDNQITDGLHVVGADLKAGTYTTKGPSGDNPVGCYYAWKTGTGSDAEIKDNNIVQGVATVTLNQGDVFESNSCQAWTKVG